MSSYSCIPRLRVLRALLCFCALVQWTFSQTERQEGGHSNFINNDHQDKVRFQLLDDILMQISSSYKSQEVSQHYDKQIHNENEDPLHSESEDTLHSENINSNHIESENWPKNKMKIYPASVLQIVELDAAVIHSHSQVFIYDVKQLKLLMKVKLQEESNEKSFSYMISSDQSLCFVIYQLVSGKVMYISMKILQGKIIPRLFEDLQDIKQTEILFKDSFKEPLESYNVIVESSNICVKREDGLRVLIYNNLTNIFNIQYMCSIKYKKDKVQLASSCRMLISLEDKEETIKEPNFSNQLGNINSKHLPLHFQAVGQDHFALVFNFARIFTFDSKDYKNTVKRYLVNEEMEKLLNSAGDSCSYENFFTINTSINDFFVLNQCASARVLARYSLISSNPISAAKVLDQQERSSGKLVPLRKLPLGRIIFLPLTQRVIENNGFNIRILDLSEFLMTNKMSVNSTTIITAINAFQDHIDPKSTFIETSNKINVERQLPFTVSTTSLGVKMFIEICNKNETYYADLMICLPQMCRESEQFKKNNGFRLQQQVCLQVLNQKNNQVGIERDPTYFFGYSLIVFIAMVIVVAFIIWYIKEKCCQEAFQRQFRTKKPNDEESKIETYDQESQIEIEQIRSNKISEDQQESQTFQSNQQTKLSDKPYLTQSIANNKHLDEVQGYLEINNNDEDIIETIMKEQELQSEKQFGENEQQQINLQLLQEQSNQVFGTPTEMQMGPSRIPVYEDNYYKDPNFYNQGNPVATYIEQSSASVMQIKEHAKGNYSQIESEEQAIVLHRVEPNVNQEEDIQEDEAAFEKLMEEYMRKSSASNSSQIGGDMRQFVVLSESQVRGDGESDKVLSSDQQLKDFEMVLRREFGISNSKGKGFNLLQSAASFIKKSVESQENQQQQQKANNLISSLQRQPIDNDRQELEEKREMQICGICFDHQKNCVLIPCGHRLCFACALPIKEASRQCPFCKKIILSIIQTYD